MPEARAKNVSIVEMHELQVLLKCGQLKVGIRKFLLKSESADGNE